jgi:hypothetical protein
VAGHQLFPPTVASSLGRTGNDAQLGVLLRRPPPAPAGTRPAAGTPVFTRYDKPKPLPTLLTLPLRRNRHGLVHPGPGRPALAISRRPGPVRRPALTGLRSSTALTGAGFPRLKAASGTNNQHGRARTLSQVTMAVLERALAEERIGHLGYEKHDPAGRGSGWCCGRP